MGQEQVGAMAPEVVDGQADPVGGVDVTHRAILTEPPVTTKPIGSRARPARPAWRLRSPPMDDDRRRARREHRASTRRSSPVTSTRCPTSGTTATASSCTHPGWATLRGWAAVSASWFALFTNGQQLQFIVTAERGRGPRRRGLGDLRREHPAAATAPASGGTVSALNLYRPPRRRAGGWWPTTAGPRRVGQLSDARPRAALEPSTSAALRRATCGRRARRSRRAGRRGRPR